MINETYFKNSGVPCKIFLEVKEQRAIAKIALHLEIWIYW
jgi:hypothetical protein